MIVRVCQGDIFLSDTNIVFLLNLTIFLQTILVGDSGVGKTSLLVQFDQGKFIPGSFSATVGIGFTVCVCRHNLCVFVFFIWAILLLKLSRTNHTFKWQFTQTPKSIFSPLALVISNHADSCGLIGPVFEISV